MSDTKSVGSDSSGVSNFIRRLTNSIFSTSPTIGRECRSTDESSCENDNRWLTETLGPIEFSKGNNHYCNNHNIFFRNTSNVSHHTVLTQEDAAWFFPEGTHLNGDYEVTERSTPRDKDDNLPPPTRVSSSTEKQRHGNRNRNHKQSQKRRENDQLCDNTTIGLLVLCIILLIILGIVIAILYPMRNTINNNNSIEISPDTSTSQPHSPIFPYAQDTTNSSFLVPTITPIIAVNNLGSPTFSPVLVPTSVPTRDIITNNPISIPTAKPTTIVVIVEDEPNTGPTTSNNNDNKFKISSLSMGPLVGHTTYDRVTLWAYHDLAANNQDEPLEILIYDYDTDILLKTTSLIRPRKDRNNVYRSTIAGLRPSTSYKYGMHIRGERVGKGSFTTAPLPNNGTTFDYVLASCMNYRQYKNQMVWDVIAAKLGKYPDFSIMAGDTVYLNDQDIDNDAGVKFDRVWFRNWEQRNESHFQRFLEHVPTYATWNDHEYGSNNGNKDQKGKGNSLRAWESLWANPGYGDETSDDGVYYSYYWGDVHYIVMDDHWYRDPKKGNRLGTKQTEWIKTELLSSKGTFKVIVIGSDIMERGWSSDMNNIGDIVRDNKIDGVIFHAGDIHRNEYKEMVTGGFPYPVKQITSSGVAKVWRRPFVHIRVDTQAADPTMTAYFYGAASMNDETTWSNDPNLVCSSIEGQDRMKEHTCTEVIRLSDLTVR